jgi:hypothetical protein
MLTNLAFVLVLTMFAGGRVEAAQSELQEIADVLDVSTTRTFQFTANGTFFSLGQSTSPAAAWPRQFVKSLTRVYDFTAGAMRDEWVRMAAQTPTVGPEQQTVTVVSGDYAWNEVGKDRIGYRGSGKSTNVSITSGLLPMGLCGPPLQTTQR